jgi:hypothetical protein
LTGIELTVTESFPAFALSTGPLNEILTVEVTLRVTVASKVSYGGFYHCEGL